MESPVTRELVRELSLSEKTIFDLLKRFVEDKSPDTVLLVAGGWVRDNVYKLHSEDIDITINNMSGYEFAQKLSEYMKEQGLSKESKVSVIKANPDQSKHLETATMTIFGKDIDFANLRKETYAESRIPTIEPGTPLEDALRRDLTINALFYNINTGLIEDYVYGLDDIKTGVAVTPIDPYKTFMDDPLRILRIIRFAVKYGLLIQGSIFETVKMPEIQEALRTKVSKERVWKEMFGQEYGDGTWKKGFFTHHASNYAYEIIKCMDLKDFFGFEPLESAVKSQKLNHKDLIVYQLAALFWNNQDGFETFAKEFKIPNDFYKRTVKLFVNKFEKGMSDYGIRYTIVALGEDYRIAYTLFVYSEFDGVRMIANHEIDVNKYIEEMGGTKLNLPVDGNDIIAQGVPAGKPVGNVLASIRDKWLIDPSFSRDDAILVAQEYAASYAKPQK